MRFIPLDCKDVIDCIPSITEIESLYPCMVSACASISHENQDKYSPTEFSDLCEKVINR